METIGNIGTIGCLMYLTGVHLCIIYELFRGTD